MTADPAALAARLAKAAADRTAIEQLTAPSRGSAPERLADFHLVELRDRHS
ncbi:hypothetical protein [Amycolatopsis sp. cmx-4-68]|uniref:hypothetical protein n=1 Tax=Amycolatopsis sp. cmx-4-68 TaxID=2790938 RepID=UPI0039782EAC